MKIHNLNFTNHLFEKQKIVFHNNLAILVGQHHSGKTEILNTLYDGLTAKKPSVLVNDQMVHHGHFQVIYLKDHFNLEDEIKLKKTSPLRNRILKKINQNLLHQEKYEKVSNEIQKLALIMENVLNEDLALNLKALTNQDFSLRFDVNKINLEGIIDKLLEVHLFDHKNQTFLNNKNLNHFLSRMVIFNVLRISIDEEDQQRPIIVLFDNPELYTTLKTMQKLNTILHELLERKNFYLVLASNSVEYLINLNAKLEHLNWIKQPSIQQFTNTNAVLQEALTNYSFLLQNKYDDLAKYRDDFDHIFDPEKDLDREWKKFYLHYWSYFLKSLYLDKIYLKDDEYNSLILESNDENQLVGTYQLIFTNLIFLVTFFSSFHLNFQTNFSSSEKKQKMERLFPKSQD